MQRQIERDVAAFSTFSGSACIQIGPLHAPAFPVAPKGGTTGEQAGNIVALMGSNCRNGS